MFQDNANPTQGNTAQAPAAANAGGSSPLTVDALAQRVQGQNAIDPKTMEMLTNLLKQTAGGSKQLTAPPPKPPSFKDNLKSEMASFMPFVGGAVQKSVKQQREYQIAEVQGKLDMMNSIYQAAQLASGGDPQKLQQILDGDPRLSALRMDKKFTKGMQKVFGSDLLNPEKQNTVFHEAMKRSLKTGEALAQMQKAHAAMTNSQMLAGMEQTSTGGDPTKAATLANATRREGATDIGQLISLLKEKDLTEHRKAEEKQGAENEKGRNERAAKTMTERIKEFKENLDYKKWKENLDLSNRVRIATMQQLKPSATLQPVAVFSRTGLHMLDDAEAAMDRLEKKGVLGSGVLRDKAEDYIFGKGLTDPSLDAETRKDIGKVRAAMAYTSSAAMRAHTGRTSKEIYDDFKNTLRIGQDWDALRGAIGETRSMMSEYADVVTPQSQKALREPVGSGRNEPSKPKIHKKGDPVPKAE